MTRKKRRNPFQRQAPTNKVHLRERDVKIIEAVYHYRVLTTSQIVRLVFSAQQDETALKNPYKVAQRRLAQLFDAGYLTRRFDPGAELTTGVVTGEILYLLDQRGNEFLLEYNGVDETRWDRKQNKVGEGHLKHLLDINSFRIEVALACQQHHQFKLLNWTDDMSLHQNYDRVRLPTGHKPVALIPDGFFTLEVPNANDPEKRVKNHFFLELDRSTEQSRVFQRKVRAYMAYQKQARERFGISVYRVLTVATKSNLRMNNLKQATERVGGKSLFWFATLSEIDATNVLTKPIWSIADRQDTVALIRQ